MFLKSTKKIYQILKIIFLKIIFKNFKNNHKRQLNNRPEPDPLTEMKDPTLKNPDYLIQAFSELAQWFLSRLKYFALFGRAPTAFSGYFSASNSILEWFSWINWQQQFISSTKFPTIWISFFPYTLHPKLAAWSKQAAISGDVWMCWLLGRVNQRVRLRFERGSEVLMFCVAVWWNVRLCCGCVNMSCLTCDWSVIVSVWGCVCVVFFCAFFFLTFKFRVRADRIWILTRISKKIYVYA